MASDQSFVDYVLEQAALPTLAARKMFGEYALYVDGKVVALVCDNQVFVKPTDAGRRLLQRVTEGAPYPGARPHWRLDDELDQADLLRRLLQATADGLPAPKPKTKRPTGPGVGAAAAPPKPRVAARKNTRA